MASFHKNLIELREKLGYPTFIKLEDKGLCVLYAEKGIDACLLEEEDYQAFKKRREFIENNDPSILAKKIQDLKNKRKSLEFRESNSNEKVSEVPLTEEEQQQLDGIAAFMDSGELYMYPENYSPLLNKNYSQSHALDISYFAQPEALKKRKGRAQLALFEGIYDKDDLAQYLCLLNDLAIKSNINFALSFNSCNHLISFCYRAESQQWVLLDSNYPLLEIFTKNWNKKLDELVDWIFRSYNTEDSELIGFSNRLFCCEDDRSTLTKFVDKFQDNKDFKKIHDITANKKTKDNVTQLWLAAMSGNIETVENIVKLKPEVDLNLLANGNSSLYIACHNGHTEIVKILINAIDEEQQNRVDFNVGDSPLSLYIACQNGHLNIVNLLLKINKFDLKKTIDAKIDILLAAAKLNGREEQVKNIFLKRENLPGFTALHAAVFFGHIEIVKALLNAGADKEAMASDITIKQMAEAMGHTNIITLLDTYDETTKKIQTLQAESSTHFTGKVISQYKQLIQNAENILPKDADELAKQFIESYSKKRFFKYHENTEKSYLNILLWTTANLFLKKDKQKSFNPICYQAIFKFLKNDQSIPDDIKNIVDMFERLVNNIKFFGTVENLTVENKTRLLEEMKIQAKSKTSIQEIPNSLIEAFNELKLSKIEFDSLQKILDTKTEISNNLSLKY